MALKKIAVFAGSFDPFTRGHFYVVKEGTKRFDEVIVLIAINPTKKPYFSLKERLNIIKDATKGLKNVKVDSTKGLTVNYAKRHHVQYLLRGIRNNVDKKYEIKMKEQNSVLNKEIKTIFIKTPNSLKNISSSLVRSKLKNNQDISLYLVKPIKS